MQSTSSSPVSLATEREKKKADSSVLTRGGTAQERAGKKEKTSRDV